MKPRPKAGGGWPAIAYVLRKARSVGPRRMWRALRSRNACKTCALGMGGQLGGMVNEQGRFPEVCKKSVQAMAADLQGAVHERFFADFSLRQLQAFTPRELEAAGRLTQPLYAGPEDAHYRPVSWEEAVERLAGKLRETDPRAAFFYLSGRSSNEAGFLLQLFARLWGTNNVHNCSYYCHQASGVGLTSVTGSGTATLSLEDLERCDLLFLIGANPASNHPRLLRSLVDLKRRGGRVVVINPLREAGLVRFKVPSDWRSLLFGSSIADDYLQPHVGGDIALLSGLAKAVLENGWTDERFLAAHTDGWPELREHLERLPWGEIARRSGVDRAAIERVARRYAEAESAVFAWAMGITHHEHGVRNVQAIANLALLRGMLGRPGAGLLPLRGHSNVQGIGSMGVTPKLKEEIFRRLTGEFGLRLPEWDGMDTIACLHAAHEGRIRFAACLGGNLFGASPDANFAHRALGEIDLVTYLSTTLNTGHAWGRGRETLILPVLARDEEPQPTTQESMFNYVRLSDGGPPRHAGPRSEVEIIGQLAAATLGDAENGLPLRWSELTDHRQLRQLIARLIPGYEAVGRIDETRREFTIAGRLFHAPRFPTRTGRARLHAVDLPPLLGDDSPGSLRLMTIRSEGQFNTVVYEDEDPYRGQERRDVVLLNREDIARLGLAVDRRVDVRSAAGELRNLLVREGELPPGNCALYYPEANVLVPKAIDPASKTPAFKSALVTVSPSAGDAPSEEALLTLEYVAPGSSRGRLNRC